MSCERGTKRCRSNREPMLQKIALIPKIWCHSEHIHWNVRSSFRCGNTAHWRPSKPDWGQRVDGILGRHLVCRISNVHRNAEELLTIGIRVHDGKTSLDKSQRELKLDTSNSRISCLAKRSIRGQYREVRTKPPTDKAIPVVHFFPECVGRDSSFLQCGQ